MSVLFVYRERSHHAFAALRSEWHLFVNSEDTDVEALPLLACDIPILWGFKLWNENDSRNIGLVVWAISSVATQRFGPGELRRPVLQQTNHAELHGSREPFRIGRECRRIQHPYTDGDGSRGHSGEPSPPPAELRERAAQPPGLRVHGQHHPCTHVQVRLHRASTTSLQPWYSLCVPPAPLPTSGPTQPRLRPSSPCRPLGLRQSSDRLVCLPFSSYASELIYGIPLRILRAPVPFATQRR